MNHSARGRNRPMLHHSMGMAAVWTANALVYGPDEAHFLIACLRSLPHPILPSAAVCNGFVYRGIIHQEKVS